VDVLDGWTDKWTGAGVSGAVAGKVSGASDGKVFRADLAGRAKAGGKPTGAGVPLTASRGIQREERMRIPMLGRTLY
jgi:hypothetical protein